MINIRYHIVSITAVFLALGIGVALGSTFLDRATVDVLDRNIRSAEQRIKATNAENERLSQQVRDARERDTSLTVVGGPELFADRLTDQPVLVVAAPGVDSGDLAALSTTLRNSGADLRGTLQLRDKLALTGDPDAGLADDLGLTDPTSDELRAEVQQRLTAALAAAADPTALPGAGGTDGTAVTPTSSTTTTTAPASPDGAQPEIITVLADRDYVRLVPGPDADKGDPILEAPGYRYVFVGAPDLEVAQNDVLLALLPASEDEPALPATVVSATQVAPTDGTVLTPTVVARVRETDGLKDRYNTVDQVDAFAGLVATVLTLEHQGEVAPGHYGQADGASAVLPAAP